MNMGRVITTIGSLFVIVISCNSFFNCSCEDKWVETYWGMRNGLLTYEYVMEKGDTTFVKTITKGGGHTSEGYEKPWTKETITKETDGVKIISSETIIGLDTIIQRDTIYKK